MWQLNLKVPPKSKLHIRGLLGSLWDYAIWRGDVPTQRNPVELVTIKGVTKRVRKPQSLTAEQFHALLQGIGDNRNLSSWHHGEETFAYICIT